MLLRMAWMRRHRETDIRRNQNNMAEDRAGGELSMIPA